MTHCTIHATNICTCVLTVQKYFKYHTTLITDAKLSNIKCGNFYDQRLLRVILKLKITIFRINFPI